MRFWLAEPVRIRGDLLALAGFRAALAFSLSAGGCSCELRAPDSLERAVLVEGALLEANWTFARHAQFASVKRLF